MINNIDFIKYIISINHTFYTYSLLHNTLLAVENDKL